jgi:hypothetical protein
MRPPVAASEAPATETLEDAWKTHKATKQDLTDAEKTAFEAARDSTKQVLAISTGIIALTITFAKDFIGSGAPGRWLALVAWFLFLASSFFGLWALNALTGSAGQLKPTTWLSIRTKNIKRPAKWQVLTFIPALLLTVVYGTVASLTAPRVTTAIRDDSLRHDAMRAVAEARILALAKARFDSLRAAPDSEATVLLSHLATVGGARLQLRERVVAFADAAKCHDRSDDQEEGSADRRRAFAAAGGPRVGRVGGVGITMSNVPALLTIDTMRNSQ